MRKYLLLLACTVILAAVPIYGQLLSASFEDGQWPAGWTTETNSGNTWTIEYNDVYACDGVYAAFYPPASEAADSWFFSSGVTLTGGARYVLEFQYRAYSFLYLENMRVMYGTGQSSAEMTTTLLEVQDFGQVVCWDARVTFTPPASGTYYIGWQCWSPANRYGLWVDVIRLYKGTVITPDSIDDTQCSTVSMNVANRDTSETYSFSTTAPASLSVTFDPANPYIATGGNQDVDVTVTPVTPADWSLITFDVTATGDTTADFDTIPFYAAPNTWEPLADSTAADYDVAAVSDGTYIYRFGGFNGNQAERYDPATDTWSPLASNPYHSRPSPVGACYVDGDIYLMNSGFEDAGNMYRYHIATDSYSQIPLPDGLDYLGSGEIVYYRGHLWIMGSDGYFADGNIYFYKYNIAAGNWTEIANPGDTPAEYLRIGQGMVQKNGKIYILGGVSSTGLYQSVIEYDIATDTWSNTALPNLPDYAYNNKAWIVGSYIFVDDGYGYTTMDNMWLFKLNDPSWTSWQAITPMPVNQAHYGAACQDGVLYAVNGIYDQDAMQAMSFCPLIACAGSGFCVCSDYNGSLDLGPLGGAAAVGGSPGYTYAWSDGLGWTSSDPAPSYTVNPANLPITISLTVTDSIGGTDTDTITIVSYPPLVVNAGDYAAVPPGPYTLGGTPAGVGSTALDGNPPYTYAWTCAEDAGWSSSLEHPSYSFGTTGGYMFMVTVTDACGTVATDNVSIDCGDLQVRAGVHRAICLGDTTVLGGNPTACNGVPPYTYSWTSDPAGFTSFSPNPVVSPAVSTRYTVIVTDVMHPGGISGSVQVDVAPYLDWPLLFYPTDGSNLPGLNVDFIWNDVDHETGYKLHISDSHGRSWTFTTGADFTIMCMDSSYGVFTRGECYTWWVQALSDGAYCDSYQYFTSEFCIDALPEPVSNTLIFASDQVTKGDVSATRTNLGMISLTSAYVDTHLTLRNRNGTVLSTLDLPVGYNQYAAYVDLLDYFPAPYNEGTIDMESTDHIYMIAGLVDNVTNDPSIYPQDSEQGDHILTPIVLRSDDWRTQVVLRNLADEDLEVTLTTYADTAGKGYPSMNRTITIPAQGYFKTDDIMSWMMDPHVYALLTAEVTGGMGEITGFARQLTSDNMGGIYPFYTVDGGPMDYVFPYVVDNAQRRSNIGLVNMNADIISITVHFVRDGYLAGSKTYDVDSYSYLPIANIIRDVTGTTGIQYTEGFLYLSASYPFRVVGGPVDNVSNDPSVTGGNLACFASGFTPLVLRSGPWTSRLVLTNPQTYNNAYVDLVLYQSGEPVGTITRTVAAWDTLVIDDIIGEFGTEDLYGSLFIYASHGVYGFVEQTTGPGGASGVYPVFSLD